MYIQFRVIITLPIHMKSERFRAFESKIEPVFRCLLGMWEVCSCIEEILEQESKPKFGMMKKKLIETTRLL